MNRDCLCTSCKGLGGSTVPCNDCQGKGIRLVQRQIGPMIALTQMPCSSCSQTGTRVATACGICNGKKVIEKATSLEGHIKPGMSDGSRIVLPGQCSESPMFSEPGDVILVVREVELPGWVRKNMNLHYDIQLSLEESLLGWERDLPSHPSGRPLHVVSTTPVRNGDTIVIKDWGMPILDGNGFGSLHIHCLVSPQAVLSDEQRAALLTAWPDWSEPVAKPESIVVACLQQITGATRNTEVP